MTIPVRLFPAVQQKEVHFHMLHEKDGSRVRQKLVCEKEGKEITRAQVVKGYELSKGKYVEVSGDELKKYVPHATNAIEITDFVGLDEIDPVYYEHSYQVAPDKGGGKPYKLLHDAMVKKGKVGIAHMVMRQKQYLCALRVMQGGLILTTMQYADEIRPLQKIPSTKVTAKEVQLAEKLISMLEGPFQPEKYHDEYRKQVLALIQKKAKGKDLVEVEAPRREEVTDLAEALISSLKGDRKPARGKRSPKRATRRRTSARKKAS